MDTLTKEAEIKQIKQIFTRKEEIIKKSNIAPFCIDSREIQKGQIFLALKGEKSNGAKFSRNAVELGCSLVIANEKITNVPDTKQITVKDTLECLVKVAKLCRENLKGKNISITGSIGKTTTKELISFLLKTKYKDKVVANLGNFNNKIGLPLTIANSHSDINFLITEMGANHLKEIEHLSKIARPNICIITSIGHAHIGEFGSLYDTANAKSEIFIGADKNSIAILNRDDQYFDFLEAKAKESKNFKKIISFGEHTDADIRHIGYNMENNEVLIRTNVNNKEQDYTIPIQRYSTAMIATTIIAAATIISIGDKIEDYIGEFKDFALGDGRNKKITPENSNITLIDGSYNSSVESLFASINDMNQDNSSSKYKVAFIGKIAELGKFQEEIYKKIELFLNEKLEKNEIDHIITIGTDFLDKEQFTHFNSTEELLDDRNLENIIGNIIKKGQEPIILIKGSNYLKMNKIVDKCKLFDKYHPCMEKVKDKSFSL